MKFFLRFTDIKRSLKTTDIKNILKRLKSPKEKIYILIDDYDYSNVSLEDEKKIIAKYEKLLNKMGISFHNLILCKRDSVKTIMERNHYDVYIADHRYNFEVEDSKYLKFLPIEDLNLDININNLLKSAYEPLKRDDLDFGPFPSKDKRWLTNYTQKELDDLQRFSKDNCSVLDHIRNQNKDFMYQVAIEYYGSLITYDDFMKNIVKYKKAFSNIGIQAGDRVSVCTPNVPAGIYAHFALQDMGAIPCMLHVYTTSTDMNYYFNKEEIKAVVMIGMPEVCSNVKQAIEGTNVGKVIAVPLTDGIDNKSFESLKTKFGITLLTSKFGKSLLNVSKKIKEFKLDKKELGHNTNISIADVIKDALKDVKVFKLPEDERFIMLDDFLEQGINTPEVNGYNEIATIIHTGGTTGRGKSALITHNNINKNDDAFEATITDFERGDSIIAIPPIFHILGLNNCVDLILRNGGKIVLISKYNKFELPKLFKKHEPQLLFGVPKIGRDIISVPGFEGVSLKNLKYYVLGGEEMSEEFIKESNNFLSEHGAKIKTSQSLGATEGTCSFTNTFESGYVAGSIGIPLINVTAKIVKQDEYGRYHEVDYTEKGEICFKGDSIMKGYLNDVEANNCVFVKHDDDGEVWLHTGDCGYMDQNGVLYFVDRIKEMFKINGEQVFPSEIKKVIAMHPYVDGCAVVCVNDNKGRKRIVASVTLKSNAIGSSKLISEEIMNLCKKHLQRESIPRLIDIREKLPETNLYKLDNGQLAKEYNGQNLSLKKTNKNDIS